MQTSAEGANQGALKSETVGSSDVSQSLLKTILTCLDDAKAEDITTIDLNGKTSIGDYMVIASGRSQRHVGALADQLLKKLKDEGFGRARVEGLPHADWVLIDTGDVITHIFRPEVREFYNLEKMWSAERIADMQPV